MKNTPAAIIALASLTSLYLNCMPAFAQKFIPAKAFRGINWACPGDNYSPDVLYISGLSSTTTASDAHALADKVASSVLSIDGTTIRLPINPPTVQGSFWPVYKNVIDTLIKKGLKVDLCCWTSTNKLGVVDDNAAWDAMWKTVVNDYIHNKSVYFEPINEPYGYSAGALETLYANFLTTYSLPNWKCFLDGTGYADNVSTIGNDPALANQYLSQHYYRWYAPGSNSTNWQDYENDLAGRVGAYSSRTVITEMGTFANTGLDYFQQPRDGLSDEVEYIIGTTQFIHDNNMGSIDWAGIRNGDSYSWWTSSTLSAPASASMIKRYQWSWHARIGAGIIDNSTTSSATSSLKANPS